LTLPNAGLCGHPKIGQTIQVLLVCPAQKSQNSFEHCPNKK